MRRTKSEIRQESIEFGTWCMKQCTPGFKGCQFRGNGIGWLDLKKKCLILNKKMRTKNAKSI
jgi:hypothetical protein